MQALRSALRAAILFAAWAGCSSTTPTAPTTPAATATSAATSTAAPDASTAGAAATPPEPSCPNGSAGTVRSYACGDPRPEEAAGGFAAPYERCPATRGGLGFSAAQTAQRRGQVEQSRTCCYLERCQTPINY